MPRPVNSLFSMISLCILGALVAAGCNLSTDDVQAVSPGDPCEVEGATSGGLICEDGVWVEGDGELDAGFDIEDAAPQEDADTGDECEPESNAQFCERFSIECGQYVGVDNCGEARVVDCESEGFSCGELGNCLLAENHSALDANICDCPNVDFSASAEQICVEVGVECGSFEPADACVHWEGESEVDCGTCAGGEECGLAAPNVCGCPCEIDGGCQDEGEASPDSPCLICDPAVSTTEFVPVNDGTACGDNAICEAGSCSCDTAQGYEECQGACVDTYSDPQNCGNCGVTCSDQEVCAAGHCEADCAVGQTECSGLCVDTDTNFDHCGDCGQPCSDGEFCEGGTCQSPCSSGEELCNGDCINTQTNDTHCGGCNQPCGSSTTCEGGQCVPDCTGDEQECSGSCVNIDTDPAHCGACNEPCGDGEICAGGQCMECADDGDCDGAAKCHDVYPVCIDACCDFVAEDVVNDVNISFDQLDIAVTEEGDPVIVFMDGDADTIRIAERISGNWYTQDITGVSNSSSTYVRLALDADGNPHVVYRRFNEWKYFWRDDSTWHEEEVWTEELSTGYTDLVVDDQGTVHIVGDHGFPESHRVNYARYSPSTGWHREWFEEVSDDRNFNWLVVDLTSNDEPVVALATWDSGVRDLYVARRQANGNWTAEVAVPNINQIVDMAVGPDDEVVLATIGIELPHNGLELTSDAGGGWQTEAINSRVEAFHPSLAIDDLGDPHIAFSDTDPANSHRHLVYTRWDGEIWQTEDVPQSQIERSNRLRIAVDGQRVMHIAVYDNNQNTLAYVSVD